MLELVICLHCLKAPHGSMISFVCILFTVIGNGQPGLILFIHGWIVDGIDGVHVVGCLCFCLDRHKRPLCVERHCKPPFSPTTLKISTENDANKAELEANFPNIGSPVGALRILKNTALTLEQKTENITTPGLYFE